MAFLNWYFLLFYCISLSCGLLIFRTLRLPAPRPKGWLYKAIIVLLVTWGTNILSMRLAVFVGLATWSLLIVIPSLGIRKIQGLIYRKDYQKAYYLSFGLRYLHPFDDWWDQPKIIQCLMLAKQGDIAGSQALLAKYDKSPGYVAQQAIATVYVMQYDWSGLLQWLQTKPRQSHDPLMAMYYCRALGETGHLHELLLQLKPFEKALSQGGDRTNYYLVQLFAAAFCGEVKLVEKLLSGCLAIYPSEIQEFWRAIAWYGAGERRIADKQLKALVENPAATDFEQAIAFRLKHPPQPAEKLLKPESYPLIAELTRNINQANIDRSYQELLERRPIYKQGFSINLFLVFVNIAVFISGIVLNFKVNRGALLDLAGFVPSEVINGEWWRIITATFIHIDWGHLLTNILTLYLLGGFVERNLGKTRYLFIYIASGVGAMLMLLGLVFFAQGLDFSGFPRWLLFLTDEIRSTYRLWVGASGSIMGMIGAIAVILFQGWQQEKSKSALRQFRLISGIIILQFAIDLSSTNVSFYSHFLGLVLGILLTTLVTSKKFNPTRKRLKS
ncbi:Rhomboid family protein [[Leptolyngbya] sp. PCC 7376]|uniref:rhomboid family intramembrane serine protease n=1 Tax=[Leptolyngbya] sp. PCC 7376 TaxID=111781 RepID=UPI00029F22AF|nr:rhomboid family intramembrane serine protease [[Leptolyngbya] sp. PCC 7376]AFY39065.1 Rhomboid family protein [[Leptolyngbya] sp. PCC 7376]